MHLLRSLFYLLLGTAPFVAQAADEYKLSINPAAFVEFNRQDPLDNIRQWQQHVRNWLRHDDGGLRLDGELKPLPGRQVRFWDDEDGSLHQQGWLLRERSSLDGGKSDWRLKTRQHDDKAMKDFDSEREYSRAGWDVSQSRDFRQRPTDRQLQQLAITPSAHWQSWPDKGLIEENWQLGKVLQSDKEVKITLEASLWRCPDGRPLAAELSYRAGKHEDEAAMMLFNLLKREIPVPATLPSTKTARLFSLGMGACN
ncbi:hypothetical protein WH50_21065 [Pokkaliibacter plantistimulans]|uniref:Secreted protein n=1 Tax=Pokkaliibacter plantistimulans TaxID=1635171 RepID=A0ABX5LRV6_9GAMM|nr:hypothetical protein [Pokkaliibacter plantistimulans]PXF29380.1 hypothetical protein WH50_21065 [Pokkaliibacter plantistimulans]